MEKSGQSEPPPHEVGPLRRAACKGSLAALFALAFPFVRPASAVETADKVTNPEPSHPQAHELADRVAITDVIMLERWSRETHYAEIASTCFSPDAWVEVSWFKGTAAQFIDSGRNPPPPDTVNFDSMGPPVIWVGKDRAIAETSCAVHTALKLEGAEVINISSTRLLWRVERLNGRWLIAGLRGIYIRDTLQTSGPNQELKLDEKKLAGFRTSYRYLSYVLMSRRDRTYILAPISSTTRTTAQHGSSGESPGPWQTRKRHLEAIRCCASPGYAPKSFSAYLKGVQLDV